MRTWPSGRRPLFWGYGGQRGSRVRGVPWIAVVPALLFLLAFHLAPGIAGSYYSFTDWNGVSPEANFVGLENFGTALGSDDTRDALLRTLLIAAVFLLGANSLGLALALTLNRLLKTRHVLRSIFFLPTILSPVVVAFAWQYLLQTDGLLNQFLAAVGLESWARVWLADPVWAMVMILVVMIWQYSGLCMIIYLAGLQGVRPELEEAAAVDGAGAWRRFQVVTWPALAPAMTTAMTLTLIFGLRVFDQVVALTGGGPAGATETLATQVWKQTFSLGNFSLGTSLALMLTALITVLSVSQALILRSREG